MEFKTQNSETEPQKLNLTFWKWNIRINKLDHAI